MHIAFTTPPARLDGAVVVPSDAVPAARLKALRFRHAEGEVAAFAAPPPPLSHQLVVGLGKGRPTPAGLRRIGGALAVAIQAARQPRTVVSLGLDGEQAAELAYGLRLRAWRPPTRYRSRADDDHPEPPPGQQVIIAASDPAAAESRFARLEHVAAGVFLARELVAAPGNLLGPAEFAEHARLLETFGVTVEVLDADGLGLLAAVGQGSARAPRLVMLRWQGAEGPPLVLVGKGITFDAGGISIKPAEHMEAMKGDMAGAAAVLGALRAIAGRRAPAHVCGVLAIAENMPSGRAVRPGDVVRSYSGQTVEVVDTDAEGRLVLADALAWAAANLKPRAMVDAATLTGAVVRVLGRHHGGLYATGDALAERLLALGEAEDERLWRLPLSERCDDDIKSDIADFKNCAWGKVPDNDDAARFLQKFVPEAIPWAHLDIAGVSEADEDGPLSPKGPTGFGVRLFDRLASFASPQAS
jgi:leucyl aminopeptidase